MREWIKILAGLGLLLVVVYWIDSFYAHLEQHDNEVNPITEIQVVTRQPMTTLEMRIASCPWRQIGKLGEALACRDKLVREHMSRSDM